MKHFKNLLWGMVFLVGMTLPQMAWADIVIENDIVKVSGNVTISYNTDWSSYESVYIENNATLTIEKNVELKLPSINNNGTIQNYGTLNAGYYSFCNSNIVNNYEGTIIYDDWYGDDYVNILVHSWSYWNTIDKPTTSKFGYAIRSCPGSKNHESHTESKILYQLHDANSTPSPYSGTPTIPEKISESNYTNYGFTANNYALYAGYYGIRNSEELYGYLQCCDEETGNLQSAILVADIVINNDLDDNAKLWNGKTLKSGCIFDGMYHTISGMKINANADNAGFFAQIANGAKVQNLGILNSNIISTKDCVGGICGNCQGNINNCYLKDATVKADSYAGGICGISECHYLGVTTITNCHVENISVNASKTSAGGICGSTGCIISKCYAKDIEIYAKDNSAGGICGNGNAIYTCYVINVTAQSDMAVGGISGISDGGTFNCYAVGKVTGNDMCDIIVGASFGNISNCYGASKLEELTGAGTGELTYKLNCNNKEGEWAQDLGKNYPVLKAAAGYCYSRDIKANWNTICLPFATMSTEDTKFYVIESLSDGLIKLQLAETLEAGKPALVYTTNNTELFAAATSTDLVAAPVNASGTNRLVGTFTDITVPVDNDHYFFGLSANKGTYVQVKNTGVALGAFRAYIECNKEGNPAAGLRQVIADEEINETAIADVVETLNDSEAQYFDMNGRKMNGLQKGINIVKKNGKVTKVYVK